MLSNFILQTFSEFNTFICTCTSIIFISLLI
nr:MAG TPA: hypothetical protein [Caudoviricetes sp.]